jgi:hypothetical protein
MVTQQVTGRAHSEGSSWLPEHFRHAQCNSITNTEELCESLSSQFLT